MEWLKRFNIPTRLTLIRFLGSLFVLPFSLVYLGSLNIGWLNVALGLLFISFAATDFFDGYLARKYGQVTAIGKVLDSIADKFLLYSTLIALLAVEKIYFYSVIILIGREIFILGLRCIASEYHLSVSVSWLAKVKTAIQMTYLVYLIINPYHYLGLGGALRWNGLELGLLTITILLSLFTAQQYYNCFIQQFRSKLQSLKENKEEENEVFSGERSI